MTRTLTIFALFAATLTACGESSYDTGAYDVDDTAAVHELSTAGVEVGEERNALVHILAFENGMTIDLDNDVRVCGHAEGGDTEPQTVYIDESAYAGTVTIEADIDTDAGVAHLASYSNGNPAGGGGSFEDGEYVEIDYSDNASWEFALITGGAETTWCVSFLAI